MKLILHICIMLCFPILAISQGVVTGSVVDSKSGKGLAFANLYIPELKAGTSCNNDGLYQFKNLNPGNYSLHISYIGYLDSTIAFTVIDGKESILNIGLRAYSMHMPMVVVTATRNIRNMEDIPNRIEVIKTEQLELLPGNNADDFLRNVSGVNVDRFSGIYSKNASITLRGLNSAQRTLILLDGVPMNKTDGGSINWSRIDPETVEKIEVIKGPVSALYGSNGMSGVVNIVTKNQSELTGGNVDLSYGTYNTMGTHLRYNFNALKENKGFYGGVSSFFRTGEGYILYPDSTRDSTDVRTYLTEGTVQTKFGYCFNDHSKVEFNYGYFDDKRGDGVKVYDPDGGYAKYTTHTAGFRYGALLGKYHLSANVFIQREDFHQQKESLKIDKLPPFAVTQYVLYGTFSNRDDNGLFVNLSRAFTNHHFVTIGSDVKMGKVNASDIYYTSTDVVTNLGKMDFYALYLQDEISYFNEKLKIIAGFRSDFVKFHGGSFGMENPTATTSVLTVTTGQFPSAEWYALSPKLAMQYRINSKFRLFASYGSGFRPPMLDDMCRNGNISKGLKLANPDLKPEKINSYEIGTSVKVINKLTFEPSVFYSLGSDFQYFVGTGDSIYAGSKMKPVLRRENIGKAEMYGLEMAVNCDITENIYAQFNYSFYHSVIKEFNLIGYTAKDLTGKTLMEVPTNQFSVSCWWKNKWVNVALAYHYKDPQWIDDENLLQSSSYSLFDVKLSRPINDHFKISLSVDNVFNDVFIDEKGALGLGRFFMTEISYKFK